MNTLFFKTVLIITSSLLIRLSSFAQFQVGNNIEAEAAGDYFGLSVSMPDAQTIAAGATHNDAGGSNAGHTRVFELIDGQWVQKGSDIDGEFSNDWSGNTVFMPDRNTLAVGTPFARDPSTGRQDGNTRVFTWNGSSWEQKGNTLYPHLTLWFGFGAALSMPDSNTIVIGASIVPQTGSIAVYTWDGVAWVLKGDIINGEASSDYFGSSVSMPDSNTVAVGASGNSGNGESAGHVRIFKWDGNSWSQKGDDIDGENAEDNSGYSVFMPDSNTVAIGAPFNGGGGPDAGHVRIYSWNGSMWVQKGSDLDGTPTMRLGGSVSMPDSNTVTIGSAFTSFDVYQISVVRTYEWKNAAWQKKGEDLVGEETGDLFGYSVCTPDLHTIGVGAPFNDNNGNDAGHVKIYSFCPSTFDVTVNNESPILMANEPNGTYQWLDCENEMVSIPGATDQSFKATENGSYAVQIIVGNCTDTSSCEIVDNFTTENNEFEIVSSVYPNPSDGLLSIELKDTFPSIVVTLRNELGRIVQREQFEDKNQIDFIISGKPGIYFVEINAQSKQDVLKMIKQ